MNPGLAQAQRVPFSERISLKVIGLFLATFVIVFVAAWAIDLMASYAATRVAESAIVVQPTVVVIDPKIQTELARVMSFSDAPFTGQILDPFNDRTGISNIARATGVSSALASDTTGGSTGGGQTVRVGNTGTGSATTPPSTIGPVVTPSEATKLRYDSWLEQARLGVVQEIDPQIFAIEDLMPVGIVSGGDGAQEVMFYSQVAEKTLSFPVGTRFYDGWLTELRPEGVVFSFVDNDRTVRMRSWSRSIQGAG
jgi:hypothetical protein